MSAAYIENCLKDSLVHGPFDLGGHTVPIERPVVLQLTKSHQEEWGLINGKITPNYATVDEGLVIDLKPGASLVRYFNLDNITVPGIRIEANDPGTAFYDFAWTDLKVRRSKRHGIYLLGDVFEGTIIRPNVDGCPGDGIRMESQGAGNVCSAIDIFSPRVRECARGIACEGFFRDCQVFGGYLGHNRGPGAFFSNGMSLPWYGVRGESNCRGVRDAQIVAVNNVRLHGGAFLAAAGLTPPCLATASVRLATPLNLSELIGIESKGAVPGFVDGIGVKSSSVTMIALKPWSGT